MNRYEIAIQKAQEEYQCIFSRCPLCPADNRVALVDGCAYYLGCGICLNEEYGEKEEEKVQVPRKVVCAYCGIEVPEDPTEERHICWLCTKTEEKELHGTSA